MLQFLQGQASNRKLGLFAVGCCRKVWHMLHKRAKKAMHVTEGFVDGIATESALQEALQGLIHNTHDLAIPRNLSGSSREAAFDAVNAIRHALRTIRFADPTNNEDAARYWR